MQSVYYDANNEIYGSIVTVFAQTETLEMFTQ